MAQSQHDAPRPTMRRKSSAQNLLSSFKSPTASAPITPAATTPTPTAPMGRDWDAQSLYSGDVAATNSPALTQGTSVEYLRDLVQKRILTLTYIRNMHEGKSHWFHTILMPKADLDRVFNNSAMKSRTKYFAILGMSLSSLLDIQQPQDLLRAISNTLGEYDQIKDESDKPKLRLFKYKLAKRHAGFAEYSSVTDTSDASYLHAPHMPFQLDYHQTLLSLLDVLSEVYHRISKIMGPSSIPRSEHMLGPLGLLSPHPGVSYLFPPAPSLYQDIEHDDELNTLYTIASAGSSLVNGGHVNVNMSVPTPWSPALGEMVLKVDTKLKKISSMLLKELDTFARNGIKDELASLDPLLRNASVSEDGGGRELYEFEA